MNPMNDHFTSCYKDSNNLFQRLLTHELTSHGIVIIFFTAAI